MFNIGILENLTNTSLRNQKVVSFIFVRLVLSHWESQATDWMEKQRLASKTVLIGTLIILILIYSSFRFIDTNILVTGRFEKKAASIGQGELD